METIRIKCPNCGAILTVEDSPFNAGKKVRCPICKQTHPFENFKLAKARIAEEDDRTDLGGYFAAEDMTALPEIVLASASGYLLDRANNKKYPLEEGMNLVGRMTYKTAPAASVPIKTEDMGFSRKHLNIDAVKGSDGLTRYYAYNAENKNATTVNSVLLSGGDKVILHDGDVIESSNTCLVFKLQ
jgi:predicted Zn finger-like uncharacterized protein